MKHLVLALFVTFLVGRAAAEEAKPVLELDAAIPRAIKLLEAKEYKVLLQTFIEPAEFSNVEREGGLEEFAKKWGSGMKAENMLKTLKAVKDIKPVMSEDGKAAVYRFTDGDPSKGTISITFIKVGESWYIKG